MYTHERLSLYKESLEDAIIRNESFVIYEDLATGKFVQFAMMHDEKKFVVDIPMAELDETTFEWLRPHMGTAVDSYGELTALQKTIEAQYTQYASEYTDWIFTKIFQLPENHDVKVSIFS